MSDGKMRGRGDQLSERLLDFVVKVLKLVDALPKTVAGKHVAGQLAASGSSSGENMKKVAEPNPGLILYTN